MGENKVDKVINNTITDIESYIKLEGGGVCVRGQDTNPPPPKKNSGVRHFLCDTDCLTLECH